MIIGSGASSTRAEMFSWQSRTACPDPPRAIGHDSPRLTSSVVRRHHWRRPRRRVHPSKPKLGIRAFTPDEIWHIDTTVIRLLDGTRAYLYAVIDNFSRKILAWRISERFDPGNTVAVLVEAGQSMNPSDTPPTLLADGGVENVNAAVDELIDMPGCRLRRLHRPGGPASWAATLWRGNRGVPRWLELHRRVPGDRDRGLDAVSTAAPGDDLVI